MRFYYLVFVAGWSSLDFCISGTSVCVKAEKNDGVIIVIDSCQPMEPLEQMCSLDGVPYPSNSNFAVEYCFCDL